MKYLHLSMGILWISVAFYGSYRIDVQHDYERTFASSLVFFAILGTFRFMDYIECVKKDKK